MRIDQAYKKNAGSSSKAPNPNQSHKPEPVGRGASRFVSEQEKALAALRAQNARNNSLEKRPAPGLKTGSRRAAELLLLMGKEKAAETLKLLSPAEVVAVTTELANIKELTAKDAQEARDGLKETNPVASTPSDRYFGGVDVARGFLRVAFGEGESERIIRNAAPDMVDKPFAFLDDLDFLQLMAAIKNESIETIAVILPRLKPDLAKRVLEALPPFDQLDVVKRVAKMDRVDTSVIIAMERVLRERIKKMGAPAYMDEPDGRQALAGILRYMSGENERAILNALAKDDPDTAKDIEEQLFTIDSLFLMTPRDLQNTFRKMHDNEIAILLKGKSDAIRERILSSVSDRRRSAILAEEKAISPIRRQEVDRATREFLDDLRERERAGGIRLLRPGEHFL